MDFDFAETHDRVFLTFYKPPVSYKDGGSPVIGLKDPKTLLYNKEEVPLYADVSIEKIEESKYKTTVTLAKKKHVRWYAVMGEREKPSVREGVYEDDEKQGVDGDSLMGMLSNVYKRGSDDIKRAMNKSLQESSGTVLSTDWKDVSSKKVMPEE